MFTERELQLVLDALESEYHSLCAELTRQLELGWDIISLNERREELEALTDKVRDLFLEA